MMLFSNKNWLVPVVVLSGMINFLPVQLASLGKKKLNRLTDGRRFEFFSLLRVLGCT